jgi:hypothetical protein
VIGTKVLDLSQESMLEIVNDYLLRFMPKLGVATAVSSTHTGMFRVEVAERQSPPVGPGRDEPPEFLDASHEPTLRVMRQEGVK